MPRTLNRAASSGWRSVSTLTTTARPAISAAVRATSGADILQGPHHAAQKSTSTGTRAFCVISSNCSGLTSSGSFTEGKGDLHAPHRPVSARCFAGIRFFWPQLLQVRTRDIFVLLLPSSTRFGAGCHWSPKQIKFYSLRELL